uniref:J domain-containing protein n=1 Tax=Trypanosoma congolense (strain IL3000) TaxID=1068625 RepID=G0UZ55_TRYCI|nr:conserved hypothetical protein [Trypanosoma congolense IL3000]
MSLPLLHAVGRTATSSTVGCCNPLCAVSRARMQVVGALFYSTNLAYSNTLTTQVRTQFAQVSGKRDHETFLAQYDPLEVLGLEESCTVDDIDEAFKKMSAKYGPNGPSPNVKMVERVFKARDVLKDPGSPYYLRAHSSDSDRHRLQFQLLPSQQRRFIKFQAGILMSVLAIVALLVISFTFRPMKRMLRAATR